MEPEIDVIAARIFRSEVSALNDGTLTVRAMTSESTSSRVGFILTSGNRNRFFGEIADQLRTRQTSSASVPMR
jgi:hypothetical protein